MGEEVRELIRLGLAEIYIDENGEEKVRLTELGRRVIGDLIQ